MVAAVSSGQIDATIAIASVAKPLAASGQVHILGWAGDLVPYQITAVFTTPAMIANHPDTLRHFAAAYQRGVADYRDAFLHLDTAGHPVTDATTDAAIPLLTKYVFSGDPSARQKILNGVGYYDPGGALDVADVLDQIRWFKAQGLVKGDTAPASMLDTHFLPTR
jgi:NitT/TauT family transport system substrate-binding protein